ncbi:MAG: hypothetical protein HOK71_19425, partial [Planctomycetaceae bacterium]|nr:hypothetical protein [Planctomycetaceae bacterium]
MDKGRSDFAIFFRFNAAGCVHQSAIRFEPLGGCFQQSELDDGQLEKIGRTQPPADFRPFAQHARIRAGDIDQNRIEWPLGNVAAVTLDGVAIGDSIAVNGTCLTVVELTSDSFAMDLSQET